MKKILESLYTRIVLWTFGSFMFIPYAILGIKYSYLIGSQAFGPWGGFTLSSLFVSIGAVPLLVWIFLKLKRAIEF